jgi:CHAD domain-containing protein
MSKCFIVIMAFLFSSPRNTDRAIRAILRERMRKALEHLSASDSDRAEGIHEARKRFKEIRAVLRLVRDAPGLDTPRLAQWFRDAGRQLSGTRDAQALMECWDKLHDADPKPLETAAGRRLHQALSEHAHIHLHQTEALTGTLARLQAELAEQMVQLPEITAGEAGFDLIHPGLERSYRAGRRQLAEAVRNPTPESFHEWRKRVKDHWYHTRLLTGAWPAGLGHRQDLLKVLSDQLGDDHDLAVLRTQLLHWSERIGWDAQQQRLLGAIGRRQTLLRRQALSLGGRLYAEKPRPFIRRLAAYWDLWAAESRNSNPSHSLH